MIQPAAYSRQSDISDGTGAKKFYRQYFLAIWVFYLVIATLLAIVVRYGVMDEDFHLAASKPFVNPGLSLTTLYQHVPPTGVASHLWFALWMWVFPGINYIGLRLVTCAALLAVAGFAYLRLDAVSAASQKKILAASWFMLVSPYFFLSTSTIMTEGPALIFMFAGLLFLLVSRLQQLFPFFLACLFLGLATIARFYFISLLPALFVILVIADWEQYRQGGFQSFTLRKVLPYLFIGIGLLPLAGLILLWGGLTPPLFDQWSELRSGVSFNPYRPVSTLIIIGLYSTPFVVVNTNWKSGLVWKLLGIALPVALILALFQINLFRTSPLQAIFSGPIEHSLGWFQSKGDWALRLGLFSIYSLSLLSLAIVIQRLINLIQLENFADKALIYSVVFVAFFVASQAFVGGNQPFYERYLIHPWPLMGYILVSLFPGFLNARTYLVLAAYSVISVIILTKWGFAMP